MKLAFLPWLILLLPLLAAAGITLFALRNHAVSARLSIGAVCASFALSVLFLAVNGWPREAHELAFTWLSVGELRADFGLRLDALSLLMTLVVTGVASAIHIYSAGYMRDDRGCPRYFAGLSLFTFAMLGIVLSNNFLQLFIFWELVGVSSYLLIGFWFERPSAADAAKKAFITNRLGDFGFLLGILVVWATLGSLHFGELAAKLAQNPQALGALATAAGVLIFCGAVGKSAQFPLHVWLPDAMEGPTPVSALIHAATMVAAGVYLLCRVFFLLDLPGSHALEVIAWTGGVTALLAALMAVQQNDIKRILAYSTLSQLGYMVMAVGVSGGTHNPAPAMYHLVTHAFFKALLFLGAGSVIHALHHEQDIWRMGGLRRKMPVTWWTFLVGTLALCGVPPFSGFYSKDAILAAAHEARLPLFALGVLVAGFTAFYMFRLMLVAFHGGQRSDAAGHAHESPGVMAWPLRALAVPSALAGFWGIGPLLSSLHVEAGGAHAGHWWQALFAPFVHAPVAAIAGLLAAAAGFGLAGALYVKAASDPLPARLGALAAAMRNRFYFDEIYAATVIRAQDTLAAVSDWLDRWIIAGLGVRGAHGTTELLGRALRLVQTGNLQTYAFLFVVGVAVVLYFAVSR